MLYDSLYDIYVSAQTIEGCVHHFRPQNHEFALAVGQTALHHVEF